MNLNSQDNLFIGLKKPTTVLLLWICALLLLGYTFKSSLEMMITIWINVEEYSHGFFIPVISIYFLWIRRRELTFVECFKDAWPGFALVITGLLLGFLGGVTTLKTVEQ